jgi:carbon storage regulator
MGYLVISRKIGERILIGENIEILVADIAHRKVDIAIRAPKEIPILRKVTHMQEEIKKKIKGEK